MERKEFEEKWKEIDSPRSSRRKVYIGNKGFIFVSDYRIDCEDTIDFYINLVDEVDILSGVFSFEDIVDVKKY